MTSERGPEHPGLGWGGGWLFSRAVSKRGTLVPRRHPDRFTETLECAGPVFISVVCTMMW